MEDITADMCKTFSVTLGSPIQGSDNFDRVGVMDEDRKPATGIDRCDDCI